MCPAAQLDDNTGCFKIAGRCLMANDNKEQVASAAIIESLELVAEKAGDINPTILKRYFDKCPASAKLMDHMDHYMLGRMLDQSGFYKGKEPLPGVAVHVDVDPQTLL